MDYQESQKIRHRDLADILLAFRNGLVITANETRESIGMRLFELLRYHEDGNADDPTGRTKVAQILRAGGLDALERGSSEEMIITAHDCNLLASGYQMDVRLFDPLFSKVSDGDSLRLGLRQFVQVGQDSDSDGVHYLVPAQRLAAGAGKISVARLVLEPGASSRLHWHPGEELLIPRQGSVEVLLCANGMRVSLDKGEYLHFYSEQEHLIRNPTKERADLIIFRVGISSLREKLFDLLRSRNPGSDVTARVLREFRTTVVAQKWPSGTADALHTEPIDRSGLGRFLRSVVSPGFTRDKSGVTLTALASLGRKYGYSRSWIYRLHHGMAKVGQNDLLQLAEIYGIAAVLFVDFALPTVRNAVTVRYEREQHDGSATMSGAMEDIPSGYIHSNACLYRIPCHRLADSDLSLAHLVLAPGSRTPSGTPKTRHPGWEILIPLVGAFEMRLGDNSVVVDAKTHSYVHFASSLQHDVTNSTSYPAELLAIRIHA